MQQALSGMQSLPWSLRNVVRILSVGCGILNVVLGLIVMITFDAMCLFAGIAMVLLGGCILAIEATFLCGLFSFGHWAKGLADFFESKPIWTRCVFYALTAIIPLLLCQKMLVILAFISSIICAAACFVIAIGRRNSNSNPSGPIIFTGTTGGQVLP